MGLIIAYPTGYSVVNFLISLLLSFGVNRQDTVVGENVTARGYTIQLIKIIISYPIDREKYWRHKGGSAGTFKLSPDQLVKGKYLLLIYFAYRLLFYSFRYLTAHSVIYCSTKRKASCNFLFVSCFKILIIIEEVVLFL